MRVALLLAAGIFVTCPGLHAQSSLKAWQPDGAEIAKRYAGAKYMDSAVKVGILNRTVQPNWIKDGTAFWYKKSLKDSAVEYVYIDAVKGRRKTITKEEAAALPFDSVAAPPRNRWRGRRSAYEEAAPDSSYSAFLRNGNLFLKKINGTEADIALTSDGSNEQPYGAFSWSPDSRYLVAYRIKPVKDSSVYYVLTSQTGTTRGQLRSQEYKQPGDPFTSYEMFLFEAATRKQVKVNTDIIDFGYPSALQWRGNKHFLFERTDRGHQRFRVIEVNVETARTRNVIEEQTPTFIYEQRIVTRYLYDNNSILWVSEKDGWRRMYMVDVVTGSCKPVNQGQWVVREVDSVDEKKKEIWFRASGMDATEDPYHIHYYRIGMDGKNLLSLTPEDGTHQMSFSKDKRFYIDNWSRVNTAPVTVLRRTADGKKIMDLEQADISGLLATGLRLPEIFHAKGRDGVTDIWGIVCRPSNFDSTVKYPVIENIYAGPQDSFVPKSFMAYSEMQSMAELGFIVVQMDGMGTANRSKAFHDMCWHNLADAGFPDRIAWIKALAAKYPYVDDSRVGLYGTSAGGQNAMGGLLFHPEFYSAAVAACGCHDNRVDKQWWNEQWMGYPIGKHYEEQSNVTNAAKLKGNLLLIVGEADTNVPPESTYRVADALIKANKTFDFLPVPGMGHSDGGPYGRAKKRDFFVKHLLGVDPPDRNK
ncbi:S9 family peptidase [Filimonas effusa]|uniref:S9 family peptidase n=1 Tax=Filimonas effusa TaxID=2508721 RepID=A0A4Q1D7N4_9BACT|nr:S9 family peptidase [Filimonas effusa]RXK85304.1 S9 family peptidase [Filimonas effusa]